MGETRLLNGAGRTTDAETDRDRVARPFPDAAAGAATDRVLGTYLHGLFENDTAREAFVERVFADAGLDRPPAAAPDDSPFDRAAALVADNVDLAPLLDR